VAYINYGVQRITLLDTYGPDKSLRSVAEVVMELRVLGWTVIHRLMGQQRAEDYNSCGYHILQWLWQLVNKDVAPDPISWSPDTYNCANWAVNVKVKRVLAKTNLSRKFPIRPSTNQNGTQEKEKEGGKAWEEKGYNKSSRKRRGQARYRRWGKRLTTKMGAELSEVNLFRKEYFDIHKKIIKRKGKEELNGMFDLNKKREPSMEAAPRFGYKRTYDYQGNRMTLSNKTDKNEECTVSLGCKKQKTVRFFFK